MKKSKKVNVIYVRSRGESTEDIVTSLETQEKTCKDYLPKIGITDNIIVLKEIQTKSKSSGGYDSLKSLIKSGCVNTVTLSTLDRISNKRSEVFEFIGLAVENRVEIKLSKLKCDEPILHSLINNIIDLC